MKTRVYLDNCCFNRPFDDQEDLLIRLETEAKMHVQQEIQDGNLELAWSFILDFENNANPYKKRREFTAKWKPLAVVEIYSDEAIFSHAVSIAKCGLRHKDSLHLACAIRARCDYFLTTDLRMLKKKVDGITLLNPMEYIQKVESEK